MTSGNSGSNASGHSVWGRVLDANGNPIPGAEIYWIAAEHAGEASVDLHATHWVARADADGRFWAPGLPSGPCLLVPDFQRIAVAGDKVRLDHAMRATIPLPEGEIVVPLPYRATSFVTIRGRVYDETDKSAVAGHLLVVLAEDQKTVVRQMLTAADGAFGFGFLAPGRYVLAALGTSRYLGGGMPVDLAGGQIVSAQIGLHPRAPGPRHLVRVRVEDELGLPVTGVPVQVCAPDMQPVIVTTDTEGRVEVTGLPIRPTAVTVGVSEFSPRGVVIPPGGPDEPIDVTLCLQRMAQVRVAVHDAATGKSLRHANLCVSHGGGDYWNWGGVLPPPGQPPRDHHDVAVLPGRVTVRAESPGYVGAQQEIDVEVGRDTPQITLELLPRAR